SAGVDGSTCGYAWAFHELGAESGATVAKTIPAATIDVTLPVTDNHGATATTTRSVPATGAPATAPTNLQKTGSGCCNTYGDFSWTPVPGAAGYEISMNNVPLGGCVVAASAVINGQPDHGR